MTCVNKDASNQVISLISGVGFGMVDAASQFSSVLNEFKNDKLWDRAWLLFGPCKFPNCLWHSKFSPWKEFEIFKLHGAWEDFWISSDYDENEDDGILDITSH